MIQKYISIIATKWLEFSKKYIALYEQVTGLEFEHPENDKPVAERVRENLAVALPDYFA